MSNGHSHSGSGTKYVSKAYTEEYPTVESSWERLFDVIDSTFQADYPEQTAFGKMSVPGLNEELRAGLDSLWSSYVTEVKPFNLGVELLTDDVTQDYSGQFVKKNLPYINVVEGEGRASVRFSPLDVTDTMNVFTSPHYVHENVLDDIAAEFAHYYSGMLHPEYYGKGESLYGEEKLAYGEGTYGSIGIPKDLYGGIEDTRHEVYSSILSNDPDPRDFMFPGDETFVHNWEGDYIGRFNTRVTGESPGEDIVKDRSSDRILQPYAGGGVLFDVSEYEKDPSNYPIVPTDESFTHRYAQPLVQEETLDVFRNTLWGEGPTIPGADAPFFERYPPLMDWELEE